MERVAAEIPALQRYARVLARDEAGRDDLVQDGLERALRNAERFEEGTNLRSWLFTIMRNAYIDGYRKVQRRGRHMALEDCADALVTPAPQHAALELNRTLPKIAAMSERDRTIFELAVFEEMPYRDVAERLDIAIGTVKSRLSRARRALSAMRHVPADRLPSSRGRMATPARARRLTPA